MIDNVIHRRMALAFVLLGWCHSASASSPALDVSQFAHAAWTAGDGFAKGAINSIAQTPDGYLWLGTEFGLLRFDGVRTTPWPLEQPIATEVSCLITAGDGTLWIGTDGGLASWKDGRLTRYAELSGERVLALLEDRSATVWVIAVPVRNRHLCAIRNEGVHCWGEESRFGPRVKTMYEDRKGHLWFAESHGLWQWNERQPTFHPFGSDQNVQALSEDADAGLLVVQPGRIDRMLDGKLQEAYRLPATVGLNYSYSVFRDRDGAIWIGSMGAGLARVHDGRVDQFSRSDGLTSDSVGAFFQDRDGNTWVGTYGGLDRFRASAATPLTRHQGFSNLRVMAVLSATDGSVWIRTVDGLDHWDGERLTVYHDSPDFEDRTTERASPNAIVASADITGPEVAGRSLFQDSRGRIWLSGPRSFGYMDDGRFVSVTGVPRGSVHAMTGDREGNLWLAHETAGLIHLVADRLVERIPWERLGHNDPAHSVTVDPSTGDLWLGFFRGGIARLRDGQVSAYDAKAGLAAGRVHDLRFDRDGALWTAAAGGSSRLKNGRVMTLSSRDGLPCDAVYWTIEDDNGDRWLSMPCGLVRIARGDLERRGPSAGDSTSRQSIPISVFDASDGIRLRGNDGVFSPHVARASDGKLWFFPLEGLVSLDTSRLSVDMLPPLVHIEEIHADHHRYFPAAQAGTVRLPPRSRDIEIGYTGLSFSNPQRVRFRYMLVGRDREWQDAGTRRQVSYSDLPPGRYRFDVTASNKDGVWNESGTSIDFIVVPAYYQTVWFVTLSITTVIAGVWGAYRLRLRSVEQHQQEISALNEQLMKAQEQERIRLAGELHDGVMQEMLAATMMLGSAKRRIPDDVEGKATIDKVQQKLIHLGTDLRQLSHGLHPPLLQEAGLPEAVRAYCAEFHAGSGIPVVCDVDEGVCELSRGSALTLFRILQEALGNTARHAKATWISVRVTRAHDTVSLSVSDNGLGFERGRLASGGLGLITMRERANQLNGEFDVESVPGRGTTITVSIPFR